MRDGGEVVCLNWHEFKRDCSSRPDGWSVHLSLDDARRFVQTYRDKLHFQAGQQPDEYSAPTEGFRSYVPGNIIAKLKDEEECDDYGIWGPSDQRTCQLPRFEDKNIKEFVEALLPF